MIPAAAGGRLAENVMHFARVLRAAGLPIGPGKVLDALAALEVAGVSRRDDFHATLASVFIDRREQQPLFDQAFHIFWRDPRILERVMQLMLPRVYGRGTAPGDEREPRQRLAQALYGTGPRESAHEREPPRKIELDASLTFSANELLQRTDFESMSIEELQQAKAAIARLRLPIEPMPTRRFRPAARGAGIDMRASLRATLRSGAATIPLRRREHVRRHPPLVVLCDISGSMSRYSRMFLHFLHALTNDRDRVTTFTFGTRLTNVSRHLKHRDVDAALDDISAAVEDWSGGTRIGACLREFNRRWSRRVLGGRAVVLLVSDGLDRDAGSGLAQEAERLAKSCHRLIWLNPLLRFEGFEAKPAGIRALLPQVDAFLPAHNLNSLIDVAVALSKSKTTLLKEHDKWK
jgi:uncharacterized protein with von Willebrand factor type A (vWA) domain